MLFPALYDEYDVKLHFTSEISDPLKCYLIGFLSKTHSLSSMCSFLNLGDKKTFKLSYFKRAGTLLTLAQLTFWEERKHVITLGHIRALLKYKADTRDNILRSIIARNLSVRAVENYSIKNASDADQDIKRYEQEMSEFIGCAVNIEFDKATKSGSLTVPFYSLEDLDDKAKGLGYTPETF